MSIVQCAVGNVQCAVCSVQCAVCGVKFAVCSIECVVCSLQLCTVCCAQCAKCSVQCSVCDVRSVYYALCSMHCIVCRVQCAVSNALMGLTKWQAEQLLGHQDLRGDWGGETLREYNLEIILFSVCVVSISQLFQETLTVDVEADPLADCWRNLVAEEVIHEDRESRGTWWDI